MNAFVDECRAEWQRLGVPAAVAEEMAAELEADLEEAHADGASAADVLGRDALDPRVFAAAWAAERGVITAAPRRRYRTRLTAALVALALVAVVGAVVVIASSSSEPARVAVMPLVPPPGAQRLVVTAVDPANPSPQSARVAAVWVVPPAARSGIVTAFDPSPIGVTTDAGDSGVDTRTVGWALLTIGLAGIVFLILSWWVGRAGSSTRTELAGRG